jgi:hypothetical protein
MFGIEAVFLLLGVCTGVGAKTASFSLIALSGSLTNDGGP